MHGTGEGQTDFDRCQERTSGVRMRGITMENYRAGGKALGGLRSILRGCDVEQEIKTFMRWRLSPN